MDPVKLYNKYSMEELVALMQRIEAENKSDKRYDGIYLYPKPIRKKLDAIARAISWHVEDRRKK